jgi:lysophospholipase L1-like esterase
VRRRWTVSSLTAVAALLAMTGIAAIGVVAGSVPVGAAPTHPYLLSLGDSYSIGYQPGTGGTPGYTAYVANHLRLHQENFGCGGATTTSLLQSPGCVDPASQDAVPYSGITQEQAALAFIAAHPKSVRLITISIGGNDFDSCSTAACVEAAMPAMGTNLAALLGSLKTALAQASDSHAKIIGITYPDVDLGLYVFPAHPATAANIALAKTSILAFDALINPTLAKAYNSVSGASFVNVTSAPYKAAVRGDDTPLTRTELVPPYGRLPVAVGEVCQLTYFCTQGNIHAHTDGYDFIGSLIVARYREH